MGVREAESGGLVLNKMVFEGKRLNKARFGMQGPGRAGFGELRYPWGTDTPWSRGNSTGPPSMGVVLVV